MLDSIMPTAYSAIGPVTGVIIALCLVVGFATYCYRQNMDTSNEQLYEGAGTISHDGHQFAMPMSRFDYDDINPHDDGDLGGNSMNRNLLRPVAGSPIIDISPYRMNAGAYRAPANGESDHGYSTMTPREDSEHLCFALVEPLIGANNKRKSMSDTASVNTSVSSPTNYKPHYNNYLIAIDKPKLPLQLQAENKSSMEMTTQLPLSAAHNIQASVTVHHPMEAV